MLINIEMTNYILIDGSYFVFFRYHAILNWFRLSHPDEDFTTADRHPDFRNKFHKTFVDVFQDIAKRLNIENPTFIVGKDCRARYLENAIFPIV